jgi:hypothetical protein
MSTSNHEYQLKKIDAAKRSAAMRKEIDARCKKYEETPRKIRNGPRKKTT